MNIALFAARSTFRNKRRSIITLITVAIGTLALCLFGGFVNTVYQGIETGIVRTSGQIHLYREGFFEYGAGRATDYDIADYQRIVDTLQRGRQTRETHRRHYAHLIHWRHCRELRRKQLTNLRRCWTQSRRPRPHADVERLRHKR